MDHPVDPADIRKAALDALSAWPRQRDRLPEHRADLLAAAWRLGNRNVAELARASDSSRDTVYRDLRARGIDPADRHQDTGRPAQAAPPGYHEASMQVAAVESAIESAVDLIARMAAGGPGPAGHAVDLLKDLEHVLLGALRHDVHRCRASIQGRAELGAHALGDAATQDLEAHIGTVTITVDLPNATTITMTLDQAPQTAPDAGFTVAATDSPLIRTALSGQDHLYIRSALAMIETVLNYHMDKRAVFGD